MRHGRTIIMAFGKSVPLKVLTSGTLPLSKVGDSVEEALVQSAPIILTSYGRRECSSLTDASQKIIFYGREKSHAILLRHRSFKAFHLQMNRSGKTWPGHPARSNIGP